MPHKHNRTTHIKDTCQIHIMPIKPAKNLTHKTYGQTNIACLAGRSFSVLPYNLAREILLHKTLKELQALGAQPAWPAQAVVLCMYVPLRTRAVEKNHPRRVCPELSVPAKNTIHSV